MECTICGQKADEDNTVKHLSLYVEGSEGTNVCFRCEMLIVGYVRVLKSVAGAAFLRGYQANKCKYSHGGGITRT